MRCAEAISVMWHTGHSEATHSPDECARTVVRRRSAHNTEYERIVANYAFRYHVKPGISGWAQVNGFRGETSTVNLMEKRVELDLWYVSNWSFWLDVRILWKTLILAPWQASAY